MSRLSLYCVILPIVFAAFAINVACGQTKQETKDFLVTKYNTNVQGQWVTVAFEGDVMIVESRQLTDGKVRLNLRQKVALKDLNPRRVVVDIKPENSVHTVRVDTTDLKKTATTTFFDGDKDSKLNFVSFYNCRPDERNTRQIAKALEHLISLCGGKAELFED